MLSIIVTVIAASVEVWLISYADRLIDMLADTPRDQIWQRHAGSLMGAAVILIVLRMVQAMETFMASKSTLLGGVVDRFSNFDTVSLFSRPPDQCRYTHHNSLA